MPAADSCHGTGSSRDHLHREQADPARSASLLAGAEGAERDVGHGTIPDGGTLGLPSVSRHGTIDSIMTPDSKQRIIHALDDLPENATVEQAIERLYFLAKVEKGISQLDKGEAVDHEEVKRRFGL